MKIATPGTANQSGAESVLLGLLFSPLEAERMARREFQNPSVLERDAANGKEWYIRYRIKVMEIQDGKPVIRRTEKWHTLGPCARMSKREAQREKDRILREVNTQVYTIQSHILWPDFVLIFDQNHISALAKPTQDNYRQQLRTHITPAFEKMKLCQIGPLEVQQLFRALETGGVARTTRNTIRGVLAAAFNCAKKWRFIETASPVVDIDIGGGPKRVRDCRVPSIEDVQRLIAECDGDVPLLIETLYTTGMRISEAAGLEAGDLDFEKGFASVSRRDCRGDVGDTKSEEGTRLLPLGGVLEALQEHIQGKPSDARVFTYQDAPIVDNTLLANYLTPRMKRLGIKFPGFGWHTFRRLHITLMQQRGLTLFDLRRQAGHADVRTTQRYIADDIGRRQEAVNGLPRVVAIRKKTG
jgi:integrase